MRFTLSAGYSDVEIRVPVVFSETKTEPVRREPRSSRQNRRGVWERGLLLLGVPRAGMEQAERSAPTEGFHSRSGTSNSPGRPPRPRNARTVLRTPGSCRRRAAAGRCGAAGARRWRGREGARGLRAARRGAGGGRRRGRAGVRGGRRWRRRSAARAGWRPSPWRSGALVRRAATRWCCASGNCVRVGPAPSPRRSGTRACGARSRPGGEAGAGRGWAPSRWRAGERPPLAPGRGWRWPRVGEVTRERLPRNRRASQESGAARRAREGASRENSFPGRVLLRRYYVQGVCREGSKCLFSHDLSSSKSSTVCKYYQKGQCAYGARCRWEPVPCVVRSRGDSKFGERWGIWAAKKNNTSAASFSPPPEASVRGAMLLFDWALSYPVETRRQGSCALTRFSSCEESWALNAERRLCGFPGGSTRPQGWLWAAQDTAVTVLCSAALLCRVQLTAVFLHIPVLRLEDSWFCLKVKQVFFVFPSALWAVFPCLLLQCLG